MAKPGKGRRFIISSFLFIAFLCTIASINEVRFNQLLGFSRCALTYGSYNPSLDDTILPIKSSDDEIRILLGILTLPDQYPRRHFLRLVYGTQTVVGARVDVKFVFCNTYFSSLPDMLIDESGSESGSYPPYHYVMKGDDDTYFRLNNLVESLRPLPRQDLYYGYTIPCKEMNPVGHYMSGMGYLISWDIVEWLKDSDIPKKHLEGPEDKVFGDWMQEGKKGKNRHNAKWSMYNYPDPPSLCTHELWPDTVAVHLLKKQDKWIRTLQYFNATQDLKPSKLYHIP